MFSKRRVKTENLTKVNNKWTFAYMVNVLNFKHFIPYFFGLNLLFVQWSLKMLSGIANSEDPDQTAPDLGLHCLYMVFC